MLLWTVNCIHLAFTKNTTIKTLKCYTYSSSTYYWKVFYYIRKGMFYFDINYLLFM